MTKLPAKSTAEAKRITFDFSKEAATGSTLSSPVTSKATLAGSDPGAAGLTMGSASVLPGTQLVQVLVSAGINGVVYKVGCRVNASDGEVHELFGRLPIGEQA